MVDVSMERVSATLERYDEPLLRKVAARLAKPRNHWPKDELILRCQEVIQNPPMLDRRLDELSEPARRLLALLGRSRCLEWPLGSVIELLTALGEEGIKAAGLVSDMLEAGVVFPVLGPGTTRLGSFGYWMSQAAALGGLSIFTLPEIANRAVMPVTDWPDLGEEILGSPVEADGLEWFLRLGFLWQQVSATPLRRTQGGGFFKRDVERLEQDALLNARPIGSELDIPDLGFLTAEWAERSGLLTETEGEVRANPIPATWDQGHWQAIESLFPSMFRLRTWGPIEGYRPETLVNPPFASAFLLTLAVLAQQKEATWIRPALLEEWIQDHHPYWHGDALRPSKKGPWASVFLLGLCLPLRLVQSVKDTSGETLVRLTPLGRWLMTSGEPPPVPMTFPKTLLVQPNLEILAYRQGLSPALISRLTKAATWKTLGAACTLQLEAETVYRALESGESLDSLTRMLDQHGTRPTPSGVLDLIRTWSNKRDRITIYPNATLLEFGSPRELEEALARGVTGVRATETVLVVPSEDQIEFKHFRLAGTRNYSLPPERCVTVEADGVTLVVDLGRSDLLLETEMPRFADLIERAASQNRRIYRLTPESMHRARESGWTAHSLETWFQQRVGQSATPAAKLLLSAWQATTPFLQTHLVLHLATVEMADGLEQWPETQGFIEQRLGPQALAVAADKIDQLREILTKLGVTL